MHISRLPLLAVAAMLPVWAQVVYFPTAAGSRLYFPQLADGGPAAQKWATTLLLVNTSTTTGGSATVSFYDDNGQPLTLDFGGGAQATLDVDLPAGGTRSLTSSGASDSTRIGWAVATSGLPITGTVLYEARQNGTPLWDVAAAGARPTYIYNSYANANLGVALVNPDGTDSIFVQVAARDRDGTDVGAATVSIPPNGHIAFGLASEISGLSSNFEGTISIGSANGTPTPFVAWTLNARDGLLSPLPSGELQSPSPQDQTVGDIVSRVRIGGVSAIGDLTSLLGSSLTTQMAQAVATMDYTLDASPSISASFNATDGKVHVSTGMIEVLGESHSAIAFLIGHMATRGVQQKVGIPDNLVQIMGGGALLADTVGLVAAGKSGFDPLGAMEFFRRLEWATSAGMAINSDTRTEFGVSDVQGRMTALHQDFSTGCSLLASLATDCRAIQKAWYPDVPAGKVW